MGEIIERLIMRLFGLLLTIWRLCRLCLVLLSYALVKTNFVSSLPKTAMALI